MENYNYYLGYIERKKRAGMVKEKGMGAVIAFVGIVLLYVGLKIMMGV